MNNIQKSLLLTGFVITSSIIIFSSQINNIFAIEYGTFRTDTSGIEFQYPIEFEYPIDWDIDDIEKGYIEISDSDASRYIYLLINEVEQQDLQSYTAEDLKQEVANYEEKDVTIMKEPTPIIIGNVKMGTYILQESENGETWIAKIWTILAGKQGYSIEFSTLKNQFNSPENIEIREHFINSLKILR